MEVESKKRIIRGYQISPVQLGLEPEYVESYDLDNRVIPVYALLSATFANKSTMLECTSDGLLKTASIGSGLEYYDTRVGTTPNNYNTSERLRRIDKYNRFDFYIKTNSVVIQFRNPTDTAYLGQRTLVPGYYSIDFTSIEVQIKNLVSGSFATHELIGYY